MVTGLRNRSGMRRLTQDEILFHENDLAQSLFIIQRGKIRLFRPKGRGFIELGVLRSGEVIGEMAYFDVETDGRRRSCSAQAVSDSEVIEISFEAFGKTMKSLNPWFKTIINTLVSRLKKTNSRVKELESSNVALQYSTGGQKEEEYIFFKPLDIVRLFAVFYLTIKAHGKEDEKGEGIKAQLSHLSFYGLEIFSIPEVKMEEFRSVLTKENIISIEYDENKIPKFFKVKNVDVLRSYLAFFNGQRQLPDDKKMIMSDKCETFMDEIVKHIIETKKNGDEYVSVDLTPILKDFSYRNVAIDIDDLNDAVKLELIQEAIVDEKGHMNTVVSYAKISKNYRAIKLMNLIDRFNTKMSKIGGRSIK